MSFQMLKSKNQIQTPARRRCTPSQAPAVSARWRVLSSVSSSSSPHRRASRVLAAASYFWFWMALLLFFFIVLQHSVFGSVKYPTSIKNVVSRMTQAMQKGLQARMSRMEVELPPGVDFGVELGDSKSRQEKAKLSDTERILNSNREVARLFTEMFSSIQTSTTVAFPTESAAFEARNLWSAQFRGTVVSIDTPGQKGYGKLRSRKFSLAEQEQALMASDDGLYVPDNTEVLILPGARPRDWKKIRKLHERLGDGTVIIAVNTKAQVAASKEELKESDREFFFDTFSPIMHYAPPPLLQKTNRELLMYFEFGSNDNQWTVAEKAKGGSGFMAMPAKENFKTIWEGSKRPGTEELSALI